MEDWVFGDGTHSALLTFQAVIRCSQAKHTLCLRNRLCLQECTVFLARVTFPGIAY